MAAEAIGVDVDVVLLGGAPVARDVDDPLDLPPLALHDPVFGSLEIGQRVALALKGVPVDLTDRVPRRDLRLQAVWKLNPRRQPVDDLLPISPVVGFPVEVALDV